MATKKARHFSAEITPRAVTRAHPVEKYILRQQGLTPDTWDREKAGVKIRREKIRAGT